jgi:hypothetical protein
VQDSDELLLDDAGVGEGETEGDTEGEAEGDVDVEGEAGAE